MRTIRSIGAGLGVAALALALGGVAPARASDSIIVNYVSATESAGIWT